MIKADALMIRDNLIFPACPALTKVRVSYGNT